MMNYAGIDYYTATTDVKSVGEGWYTSWNSYKDHAIKVGSKVSTARRYGYNCVVIAGLTWGVHDGGRWIMTSSGQAANLTWSRVLPSARRVTRLDLQYTFKSEERLDLREVYDNWVTGETPAIKGTVMANNWGGQTFYLGSRSSNQYGRFYDKSAESGLEVKNVYRLEVELKKPRADVVLESLYSGLQSNSLKAVDIRDYVVSWFADRGALVDVDFNRVRPIQLSAAATSDEKKLIWLKTGVAPTVADLIQRGKGLEVAKALGLKSEEYQQLGLFAAGGDFDKIDIKKELDALGEEMDALGKEMRSP